MPNRILHCRHWGPLGHCCGLKQEHYAENEQHKMLSGWAAATELQELSIYPCCKRPLCLLYSAEGGSNSARHAFWSAREDRYCVKTKRPPTSYCPQLTDVIEVLRPVESTL
jgi:hypothetical protein